MNAVYGSHYENCLQFLQILSVFTLCFTVLLIVYVHKDIYFTFGDILVEKVILQGVF